MIFRTELVKLIKAGRKTQTRRLRNQERHCRYRKGHVYQVQSGRGRRGLFPITITDVRDEFLLDISLRDAKREGFITRSDFFDYWRGIHGEIEPDLRVWVISFALGDLADRPRLLAARPGAPHGDYVTEPRLAMKGEQEAVSERDLEKFGKVAHARSGDKAYWVQERRVIAESLARMRAKLELEPNRDCGRTVRALEHQLASLERKIETM